MRLGRSCDRIVTGKVVPGCGSGRSDILRYYLPLATLPIRVRKLENDALSYSCYLVSSRCSLYQLQIFQRDVSYVMVLISYRTKFNFKSYTNRVHPPILICFACMSNITLKNVFIKKLFKRVRNVLL